MAPRRKKLPVILRRARKNPHSSIPSDEAAADHPLDVAEEAIGVRSEEEEEDRMVTQIVDNSIENTTVAGWETITHSHVTSSSSSDSPFSTLESTLIRERKRSSTSRRSSPIHKIRTSYIPSKMPILYHTRSLMKTTY